MISSLASQHITPAIATCEVLKNFQTQLYLVSPASLTLSPLLCWASSTFFWRVFSQVPNLVLSLHPLPVSVSSLRELMGSNVSSRQVIPLCPLGTTLSFDLAAGLDL